MTAPPAPRTLTRRQREVLALAANGNTNQQIATWLHLRPDTVAATLDRVYKALGANDRAHAVTLAIWHGEITLADLATIAQPSQQQEAAA